ncbi:MAG: RsmB/NOP family class I SAM-dependent RNA methyltransferase [Hyphomicrobiales bacterium]
MERQSVTPHRPLGLSVAEETAGFAVRKLAIDGLARIFGQGVSFDEFLDSQDRLAPRDRAFLHALIFSVLRHKGEIEAVIAHFMAKPLPRRSGPAPLILLLGGAQLLFLDTPAHAAIDLSVRLAKEDREARHFTGLINAVLRKIAAEGGSVLNGLEDPRRNTPDWLWTSWTRAYGPAQAAAIAKAHRDEPPLDITPKSDVAGWAVRLGGLALPTGSVRLAHHSGPIEEIPGFAEGAWWIQDAAAAMPARLFGDLAGKTALDLCAAPGGKTLQLCAAGARVTAVDISAQRVARLRENLQRTKLEAEVIVGDLLAFDPPEKFDAVLLDAPCSATGTIRRHPDLPYVKSPVQIKELEALQRRMLDEAAQLLKPDGILVYCTCSLEPAEGQDQSARFLSANPTFSAVAVAPGEAGIESHFITAAGNLRTLPFMPIGAALGLDGFFAARLTLSK